jgi:hypothetical protein
MSVALRLSVRPCSRITPASIIGESKNPGALAAADAGGNHDVDPALSMVHAGEGHGDVRGVQASDHSEAVRARVVSRRVPECSRNLVIVLHGPRLAACRFTERRVMQIKPTISFRHAVAFTSSPSLKFGAVTREPHRP